MTVKSKAVLLIIILIMAGGAIFLIDIYPAKGAIGSHPRIWLTADKLAELRSKACRNEDGSVIGGCTPHSTWIALKAEADRNINRNFYGNDGLNWDGSYDPQADSRALSQIYLINLAITYQITRDTAYARAAINKTLQFWDSPYGSYTLDSWITYNQWYTSRYMVPGSALVFDWTYDQMTDNERTRFINQLDTWGGMIQSGIIGKSIWGHHDSSNNYYYGYKWALASAGYAIKGYSVNADTYINYVKNSMVPEALNQVNDTALNNPICLSGETSSCRYYGASKGGEWSEGNVYGRVNTEMLASSLLAIKSIDGNNFFSETQFFDEYVLMNINTIPPAQDFQIDVGDDGGGGLNSGGKFRVPFQLAIIGATLRDMNSQAAQYGQYFLDQNITLSSIDFKLYNDFIWYPTSQTRTNYNALSSYNFAEGMKIQTYRSNWGSNALWLYSRFNQHYSDHTNDGMGGHFSLFKNGWLIKDAAYDEYPGSDENNIYHNVVYFPFSDNRYMVWGNTQVLHRKNTASYYYYAGDATDVYLSTEADNYRSGVTANLVQRSFFYIKDNYLAVYDRTNTVAPSDEKIWQIYLGGLPSVSGDTVSYYNGVSKVFVKSLLPLNPLITIDTYDNEHRMNVRNPVAQNYNNFLNVIEVKDGDTSVSPVSLITSTTGNLVGSFINQQFIVLFSVDNENVSETKYAVSASGAVTHFITGLSANTNYYFSGPTLCNHLTTNSDGVLSFTSSGSGTVNISTSSIDCQILDLIPSPYTPETPEICQEDWFCAEWSACFDGVKSRVCSDSNQCGATSHRPALTVACSGSSVAQNISGKRYLSVAPARPGGPQVKIYDQGLNLSSQFFAYDKNFRNGVNTSFGDVDGDGNLELVAGTEGTSAPHLRIFSLKGQLEYQFFGFPITLRVGTTVAAGDVDADGLDEIIVAPQERGGPQVRIFKYNAVRRNFVLFKQFFAFPNTMRLGLNLAVGDLDNNGKEEIIVAPKNNGGPQVRVFELNSAKQIFELKSQFFAYAANFRGGVNLAIGDVDNDGVKDIITGPGPAGASHVRIFDVKGKVKYQYFAAATSFRGGVDVSSFDYDSDGADEIITGPYSAGPPGVIAFQFNPSTKKFFQDKYFLAFPSTFRGGIRLDGY